MRLYIAGPMASKADHGKAAFESHAKILRDWGYDVVSPYELTIAEFGTIEAAAQASWEHHLKRDLRELLLCDGVALLIGWQDSRGATLEREVAMRVGIEVRLTQDWLVE